MEFDVTVTDGKIELGEKTLAVLSDYRKAKIAMEQAKMYVDAFNEVFLKTMEENGIKKFENDLVVLTYTAQTVRKTVDTEALKEQGLYDSFTKEVPVKASVKVRFK